MAGITEQEVFEFAKAAPPPEPVAETPPPAVEETPPAEPAAAAEPPAESTPSPEPAPPEAVPSWRLREEAEARRAAEDRARGLEARLQEIAAHLQQQQPQKNDFFENPDQATSALIQRYVQPYIEENRRVMMALGKNVAEAVHGADRVSEAEQAFLSAMNDRELDSVDYERVVQAPNRYDAVVQWHKRQSVLASVGDDPAAWFDKQLEARLADPKFQASLLEKVRGSAATAKPGSVQIPPSLSKATAAASSRPEAVGDMSDSSLFAHAMKR